MLGSGNRSIFADSAGSVGFALLTTALRVPTSILIARSVGPSGKGVSTLILLVVVQISLLSSLGIDLALIHFGGSRRWSMSRLASTTAFLGLLLALPAFLISFGALLLLSEKLGGIGITLQLMFALLAPVTLLSYFVRAGLRFSGHVVEEAILNVVQVGVALLLLIVVVTLGAGLPGVLVAQWSSVLVAFVVALFMARRIGLIHRPSRDADVIGSLCAYGGKLHIGSVVQSLNFRVDVYVLALMVSTSAVGIYAVAVATCELLLIMPSAMQSIILHRVATGPRDSTSVSGRINRLTSLGMIAAGTAAAIVGAPLITGVYGSAFSRAYLPFVMLLPGLWSLAMWTNLTNDLLARGHPTAKSWTAVGGLGVTLTLIVAAINQFGIRGAALTSSVSYSASFVMALILYCRRTGQTVGDVVIPRAEDVRLALAALRSHAHARRSGTSSVPRASLPVKPEYMPPTNTPRR